MESLISTLQSYDETVFRWINQGWAHPIFDSLMPWFTNLHKSTSGLVLLVAVVSALLWRERKRALVGLGLSAVAMGLSDMTSHYLIKQWAQRPRPTVLADTILRTFPHVGFSFPSNHAANNMALAVVLSLLIPKWRMAFFSWALLIGVSRIYVGVHYPSDVVGGFLVGGLWAATVVIVLRRIRSTEGFFREQNSSPSS
jgi:undecaprenyl-diphosphatase